MVKNRPGSRKGITKFGKAPLKAAKKRAAKLGRARQRKQVLLHDAMRDVWDDSITPAENLGRLGLVANVNVVHKSALTTKRTVSVGKLKPASGDASDVDMGDKMAMTVRRRLEAHAAMPERGTKQIVRPGERVALEGMVARYGNNWTAMARDIKLNYLQWTPSQLQKRVERMQAILNSAAA